MSRENKRRFKNESQDARRHDQHDAVHPFEQHKKDNQSDPLKRSKKSEI